MSLSLPLPSPAVVSGGGGVSNIIQQFDSNITVTDVGASSRITANINNSEVFRIDNDGRFGLGTTIIDTKRLEINDPTGQTLRLIYNDPDGSPNFYSDICVDSAGQLLLYASGNDIKINASNNLDIISHNGTTNGLKLGGELLTVTASQLNYNNISTLGTVESNKVVTTDTNRDITNINIIEAETGCFSIEDNATNTALYPLKLRRTTTSSPATNLGVGINFELENSANINKTFGTMTTKASLVTDTDEHASFIINLMSGGTLTERATLDHLGQFTVTNVIETSDMRVKENIVDADLYESFKKIQQVKIKDYNFKGQSEKDIKRGVIAQQLKEIIPSAVHLSKKNGYDDFHSVESTQLLGHLIASVQYLIKKLDIKE